MPGRQATSRSSERRSGIGTDNTSIPVGSSMLPACDSTSRLTPTIRRCSLESRLSSRLRRKFALFTSVLTHTILYHGAEFLQQAKSRDNRDDDVHMRLIRNYKQVPDWWYGAFLVVALATSVGTIAISKADMPIWSLLLIVAYTAIVFTPIAIIYATLSYTISFNMIVELAAGYIMPGRPLANMLFKLYALGIPYSGTYFLEGMKLAHYQKLPPKIVFGVQLFSTLLAALVQVATKRWLVATIPDLCATDQPAGLSCPNVHGYTAASTIWGLIGPAHLFGTGKMYHSVLYWMIPGAVLPCATWYLRRRYTTSWLASLNVPAALIGSIYIPPLTGINYSSAFVVGFIFQYFLRRRRPEWWSKYNYLLSGGLDAGTSICGVVIFLTLLLPKNGQLTLDWWGNTVYMKTADWLGTPFKTPPPEGFGPTTWS
ncbi:hypothetical protein BMF94_4156 [Rhodotorula taiwanensis]|uniref:Oligopeptide transporter n=1 Tax=Rhodotorula taiwanensis TaxID=741276 RepID=A0A2S5B7K2_9BASI|nr:hypothetical protein BMF94_4156 [Rhodotorula taiwanensis]